MSESNYEDFAIIDHIGRSLHVGDRFLFIEKESYSALIAKIFKPDDDRKDIGTYWYKIEWAVNCKLEEELPIKNLADCRKQIFKFPYNPKNIEISNDKFFEQECKHPGIPCEMCIQFDECKERLEIYGMKYGEKHLGKDEVSDLLEELYAHTSALFSTVPGYSTSELAKLRGRLEKVVEKDRQLKINVSDLLKKQMPLKFDTIIKTSMMDDYSLSIQIDNVNDHSVDAIALIKEIEDTSDQVCLDCYCFRNGKCCYRFFESTAGYHCPRDGGPLDGTKVE